VAYDEPDNKARFGFPLNNGWKVIGELYRTGELSGYFDSSEKEAWVPAWYTRGVDRCPRDASWFFEIRNLEPWADEDALAMEHYLRQGFEKWGRVQVNGRDKLIIYQRTGNQQDYPTQAPNDGLRTFAPRTMPPLRRQRRCPACRSPTRRSTRRLPPAERELRQPDHARRLRHHLSPAAAPGDNIA
jgi:hypothetical protein